jgi:hypothetical protein
VGRLWLVALLNQSNYFLANRCLTKKLQKRVEFALDVPFRVKDNTTSMTTTPPNSQPSPPILILITQINATGLV